MIYLSNRPQFLWVYRHKKPTQDVARTQEKLVNHELRAIDSQTVAILVISTNIEAFITPHFSVHQLKLTLRLNIFFHLFYIQSTDDQDT